MISFSNRDFKVFTTLCFYVLQLLLTILHVGSKQWKDTTLYTYILSFILWHFKGDPKISVINKNKTKSRWEWWRTSDGKTDKENKCQHSRYNSYRNINYCSFQKIKTGRMDNKPDQLHTIHYIYIHILTHTYMYIHMHICV